jgi:hypothetical protein
MIEVISRSSKKLVPIEFSYKEGVKDPDAAVYAEGIGKLPLIIINGVQIETKDVSYFKLHNDKFMPEIEMIFSDPTNRIFDSRYPLDSQILSIMMKSNETLLMPIRMDLWIGKFISVKNKAGDSDYKQYELTANLDVPIIIKFASYKGTSYNVLKKIANMAEMGFASNIENTDDNMTWINSGIDHTREFIPEIVKHSYINDNTFLWAYVDFWYNLNYIDVEKQLNLSTNEDKSLSGNEAITGEKYTIPLILSNHPDYNMTNQYIDKFNLINESTNINREIGYKSHIYFYDIKEKEISNVLLDTISTKGDKNDKIVLKGQPDDNQYAIDQRKNYFLGKNNIDNAHKNYLYAEKLNEHNLKFLQKVRMNIVLSKLNFQLYRFQSVNIQLYKLKELDSDPNPVTMADVEQSKNMDKYKLNERLSGDWIILGINYTYVRKGDNDKLIQEITVARRELSAAKIAKNE